MTAEPGTFLKEVEVSNVKSVVAGCEDEIEAGCIPFKRL
jgi:hypothetical protein